MSMRVKRNWCVALVWMATLLICTFARAQISPEESIKTFKLAEGLECTLFASEPLLVNPCDIDVDARVLVSCSPNIFLFTDTDGDGKADKKEVIFSGISGFQHDHGAHTFVFGPDGKIYFNLGNEGKQLKTPDGKDVIDMAGNVVAVNQKKPAGSKSGPYRMGLVFRMNPPWEK